MLTPRISCAFVSSVLSGVELCRGGEGGGGVWFGGDGGDE